MCMEHMDLHERMCVCITCFSIQRHKMFLYLPTLTPLPTYPEQKGPLPAYRAHTLTSVQACTDIHAHQGKECGRQKIKTEILLFLFHFIQNNISDCYLEHHTDGLLLHISLTSVSGCHLCCSTHCKSTKWACMLAAGGRSRAKRLATSGTAQSSILSSISFVVGE